MLLNITFHNNNELDSNFIFNSTSFKIFHGIASIFVMLVAFFSYSGFIHYEYYGEDPMKRSMKNKLVAQMCKAIFIYNLLATPVFTWRILIGPINENLSTFTLFIRHCNGMIIPMCYISTHSSCYISLSQIFNKCQCYFTTSWFISMHISHIFNHWLQFSSLIIFIS